MRRPTALVLVLLLAGCSGLKIMYGFADTLLHDRAETYLDLSADDEAHLETEIESLLFWHRTEMLPKYAVFLEARAQEVETGTWTRDGLLQSVETLRALIRETASGAAPAVGRVLARQTAPDRVAYLRKQMAENLQEARDERGGPPDERLENLVDRRVDNFERFTGPLKPAQVDIIRDYAGRDLDGYVGWLDYREKRNTALADFMAEEPDAEALAVFVETLMNRAEEIVGQGYRTRADAWWIKQVHMIHDVLITLDDDQRQDLARALRGYAVDMTELADASQ